MSITRERKQDLLKKFQLHEKDKGSMEVQVAILTERIKNLTTHLKANPKDFSSRRGLLKLVGRRSAFLKYLKKHKFDDYKKIIKRLKLRK